METIINDILKKLTVRDYSGSLSDNYAQDLKTFHLHSCLQGKEKEFLSLLAKAEMENKRIVLDPKFEKEMDNILYDDIPFDRLILV